MVATFAAFAESQSVREVKISVLLKDNGDAQVRELWTMSAGEGTEMYLVKDNLEDIEILNLSVRDTLGGLEFVNEGEWDVDRSLQRKAGRCGFVRHRNGVEICWGLGSYGDHVFEVNYLMTNAVQTMEDSDCLHIQFIAPGMSAAPRSAGLTVSKEDGTPLSTENSQAWGFGFEGSVSFEDGSVIFRSTEAFRRESSLIALLRFDKGLFNPVSVDDRDFSERLDRAMEGETFKEDDLSKEDVLSMVLTFLAFIFGTVVIGGLSSNGFIHKKIERRRALGKDYDPDSWSRDIPLDGNLEASDFLLTKMGFDRKSNCLASALILRMIHEGKLSVFTDAKGKVEISFNDYVWKDGDDPTARGLYDMMQKASGSDRILQDKEFSRWSRRHSEEVLRWQSSLLNRGKEVLESKGWRKGSAYSPEGKLKARGLVGFRKYLSDFTLTGERRTAEVALWKEYLVFGAIFGIAEQVAKELHDIDPKVFDTVMAQDYNTMTTVLRTTRSLSRAITNAPAYSASNIPSGRGGFGGTTSFGGGGGFRGGGFGGGVR